jgi:hypothetical protein
MYPVTRPVVLTLLYDFGYYKATKKRQQDNRKINNIILFTAGMHPEDEQHAYELGQEDAQFV